MIEKPNIFLFVLLAAAGIIFSIYLDKNNPMAHITAHQKPAGQTNSPHGTDPTIALYSKNCSGCHGAVGQGMDGNPSLQNLQVDKAEIMNIIRNGRGKMKPLPKLTDQEISQLADLISRF